MMETQVTLAGNPVSIHSAPPALGHQLPAFRLVDADLQEVSADNYKDKTLLLNIFPSLDTDTCAQSVRRFNQEAAARPNLVVLCISADLPFAQKRFCETEGITNVVALSAYRASLGEDFGIRITSGPLTGLLARTVLIADPQRKVLYAELVSEITAEPNYAQALNALPS